MQAFIIEHEVTLRLIAAATLFALMAFWEIAAPRRANLYSRRQRWLPNLGLMVLGTLLLRLGFPFLAVFFANQVEQWHWGVFNVTGINDPVSGFWSGWLAIVLAIVLLDLGIYTQHLMSHKIPLLWRLHRVHHADPDFDVSTAVRFHPLEIGLSMGYKFLLIALIGAPVVAVILFEILLNGCAMFNHGNVRLPAVLDKYLRWLLVTPDVHRIHHSYIGVDTNSNYGFSLVFWDRLFHTYRAQPQAGHADITLGMPVSGRPVTCTGLWRMLVLPFVHVGAKPLATPLEKASRNEPLP